MSNLLHPFTFNAPTAENIKKEQLNAQFPNIRWADMRVQNSTVCTDDGQTPYIHLPTGDIYVWDGLNDLWIAPTPTVAKTTNNDNNNKATINKDDKNKPTNDNITVTNIVMDQQLNAQFPDIKRGDLKVRDREYQYRDGKTRFLHLPTNDEYAWNPFNQCWSVQAPEKTALIPPKPAHITLDGFLAELLVRIDSDGCSNSFTEFRYNKLPADNTFYVAMRAYEQNGTPFYADFLANRPNIKIKKKIRTPYPEI
jgi:hypothetical protein